MEWIRLNDIIPGSQLAWRHVIHMRGQVGEQTPIKTDGLGANYIEKNDSYRTNWNA